MCSSVHVLTPTYAFGVPGGLADVAFNKNPGSEKCWADAGLLLILRAQKIATISHLTIGDLDITGETGEITFGTSPVVLPTPVPAPLPCGRGFATDHHPRSLRR